MMLTVTPVHLLMMEASFPNTTLLVESSWCCKKIETCGGVHWLVGSPWCYKQTDDERWHGRSSVSPSVVLRFHWPSPLGHFWLRCLSESCSQYKRVSEYCTHQMREGNSTVHTTRKKLWYHVLSSNHSAWSCCYLDHKHQCACINQLW